MTLHELESSDAVRAFSTANKNVVVCFSATWCGPCKASKPALEQMATTYEQDVTKDVNFGIIYEHNLGESIHDYNVKAFPTYVLFQGAVEKERAEGANLGAIEKMIEAANCGVSSSQGQSLGGSGSAPLTAEQARAQRIARLGGNAMVSQKEEEVKPAEEPKDVEMKEGAAVAAKEDVEMEDASKEESEAEVTLVDPTANLNKEHIETLTGSMRFSLLRAQKGILKGGSVEGAVEWLLQHQEDADIDDPIPLEASAKAQSYRCNDCKRILSNMANLELHANKTGHSDFEESTEAVKPLTAEEKIAKMAQIKELLTKKRTQREEVEKEEDKEREQQRRFMGKEVAKTKEQMERGKMKREAQLRKKQKHDERKERDRIVAELEKDKAERRANKGKLSGKLGVKGYNPDAIQYGKKEDEASAEHDEAKPASATKGSASPAKIDEYIKRVSSYRAGGDGGKCLKILWHYVGNAADKPDEEKFRSINMENKVFKTKVKPFIGAKTLLMAVGFSQNNEGTAMILGEGANVAVMKSTKEKLEAAYAAYSK